MAGSLGGGGNDGGGGAGGDLAGSLGGGGNDGGGDAGVGADGGSEHSAHPPHLTNELHFVDHGLGCAAHQLSHGRGVIGGAAGGLVTPDANSAGGGGLVSLELFALQ